MLKHHHTVIFQHLKVSFISEDRFPLVFEHVLQDTVFFYSVAFASHTKHQFVLHDKVLFVSGVSHVRPQTLKAVHNVGSI